MTTTNCTDLITGGRPSRGDGAINLHIENNVWNNSFFKIEKKWSVIDYMHFCFQIVQIEKVFDDHIV